VLLQLIGFYQLSLTPAHLQPVQHISLEQNAKSNYTNKQSNMVYLIACNYKDHDYRKWIDALTIFADQFFL